MKTIKWCNFHNVTMARCENTASRRCVPTEITVKVAYLRAKGVDDKDERYKLLDEVKKHFEYHEHPHDLIELGKKFDAMKEQRDRCVNALKEAKEQLGYVRRKLSAKEYRFTSPTSIVINDLINESIKSTE